MGLIGLAYDSYGQSYWAGLGYASSNSVVGEFVFSMGKNLYKVGASMQFPFGRGLAYKSDWASNGTFDGTGKYFVLFDVGYGRVVSRKWSLEAEVSMGVDVHYTNFIYNHSTTNQSFHIVTDRESLYGFGLNAGYGISKYLSVFAGYNTIKSFQVGIRIW